MTQKQQGNWKMIKSTTLKTNSPGWAQVGRKY